MNDFLTWVTKYGIDDIAGISLVEVNPKKLFELWLQHFSTTPDLPPQDLLYCFYRLLQAVKDDKAKNDGVKDDKPKVDKMYEGILPFLYKTSTLTEADMGENKAYLALLKWCKKYFEIKQILDTNGYVYTEALESVATLAKECSQVGATSKAISDLYTFLATLKRLPPGSRAITSVPAIHQDQFVTGLEDLRFLVKTIHEVLIRPDSTWQVWRNQFKEALDELNQYDFQKNLIEAKLVKIELHRWENEVSDLSRRLSPSQLLLQIRPVLWTDMVEERRTGDGYWEANIPLLISNQGDAESITCDIECSTDKGAFELLDEQQHYASPAQKSKIWHTCQSLAGYQSAYFLFKIVDIPVSANIEFKFKKDKARKGIHYIDDGGRLKIGGQRDINQATNTYKTTTESTHFRSFSTDTIPSAEFEEWGCASHTRQAKEVLAELRSVNLQGLMFQIIGLRRSGKTSFVRYVQYQASETEQKKFISVYIDLNRFQTSFKETTEPTPKPDQFLWHKILEAVIQAIDKHLAEPDPTLRAMLKNAQEYIDRKQPEAIKWNIFYDTLTDILRMLKEKHTKYILLALDEADSLARDFSPIGLHLQSQNETNKRHILSRVALDLRELTEQSYLAVMLVHTYAEVIWEKYFYDRPSSNLPNLNNPDYDDCGYPNIKRAQVVELQIMSEPETQTYVTKRGLRFTPLAWKTFWMYTGGYQAIVNVLGKALIDGLIDVEDPTKQPNIYSVEDVKLGVDRVLTNTSLREELDFVYYGFSLEERVLLGLIARYFTDAAGCLHEGLTPEDPDDKHKSHIQSQMRANRLSSLVHLLHKPIQESDQISRWFSPKQEEQQIKLLLRRAIHKQIITRQQLSERVHGRYYWRVGLMNLIWATESAIFE